MKKNIFTLIAILAILLVSCSKDPIDNVESSENLNISLTNETNIGTYKGVFTTLDSQLRGVVDIEIVDFDNNISAVNFHRATITLQNGDVIFVTSKDKVTSETFANQIVFSSRDIMFNFSVNKDGSNPVVSNLEYNNNEAYIILAKHTSRAPVTAITGTYNCVGCNVAEKTFSFVISNDGTGNQTYSTQVNFNGVNYSSGVGYQNNCAVDGDIPTLTSCAAISGTEGVDDIGFLIEADPTKPVTWQGEVLYNNEVSGSEDCTEIIGAWFFKKGEVDEKSGIFISDNTNNCYTLLNFEGFGGTPSYTTSIPEFTDGTEDYFKRTDGSDISAGVEIDDIIGNYFFAAQDIDGDGASVPANISFGNIDITGLSTIFFSAQFAEDDDGFSQDWDVNDYVHVDYSFDGGATWVTFFAIENDGSTFNSAPFVDTNLDGTGDGQEITNILTNFKSSFVNDGVTNPTASTTVSIRINIRLESGDEDIAIDNVLIRGI